MPAANLGEGDDCLELGMASEVASAREVVIPLFDSQPPPCQPLDPPHIRPRSTRPCKTIGLSSPTISPKRRLLLVPVRASDYVVPAKPEASSGASTSLPQRSCVTLRPCVCRAHVLKASCITYMYCMRRYDVISHQGGPSHPWAGIAQATRDI